MGHRLPTILGKAIEDVVRSLNELSDRTRIIDLNACIQRMQYLMADLVNNEKLRTLKDDGEADVALWNKEIVRFFRDHDFMSAPWVFAEAYKYRRLHECFSVSKYFKVSSLTLMFECALIWIPVGL